MSLDVTSLGKTFVTLDPPLAPCWSPPWQNWELHFEVNWRSAPFNPGPSAAQCCYFEFYQ